MPMNAKIVHAVDLGAGFGEYIDAQARLHPARQYVAVEPFEKKLALAKKAGYLYGRKNVVILLMDAFEAIDYLSKNNFVAPGNSLAHA